jgi:hypothetical protein
MLFLISNIIVELSLSVIWWIVKNILYGMSNYIWGLVYQSRVDKKFYIDENKWKELIENNKIQHNEIHKLRGIIEKWTELKSSRIERREETEEEIEKGLRNYLEESIIDRR